MIKNNVEKYIDELKNFENVETELDLYSLKKELNNLNASSKIFDNFEKESTHIDKDTLKQVQNLSSLMKIRSLASEIKNKKHINGKLHDFHFNLNLLNNASDIKALKNTINLFLCNDETKIDAIIDELNDFKTKLDEIKRHHKNLLPTSLDNKLNIESKYGRHIEKLHSIHKRQKDALISTVKLFLKLSKKQIKNLQKFK